MVGAPIEGDASRLAHALSYQRLRWASSELPRPHPTVISHRDVHDRLATLLPFFVQGTAITPIVLGGDSLFWSVDLYVASSFYPLSRHIPAAGDDRTYFQHAATAIIYAASGETFVVADSSAGPPALTWIKRFPTLFAPWNALPAGIRTAVPPAIDGLRAQTTAFAEYGTRADSDVPRHTPILDGADSALAASVPLFAPPGSDATAVGLILLDASDRVRGVVIGRGGADRQTLWFESPRPGPKWSSVLDRLRAADSATSAGARDAIVARGPIRPIAIRGTLAFAQPIYSWRGQAPPALLHVVYLSGDTAHVAPSLAQLAGAIPPVPTPLTPTVTGDVRARAADLYARMRDALRRGDWAAFGQAFEELGKLVGGGGSR
jgi:hypothetical protein